MMLAAVGKVRWSRSGADDDLRRSPDESEKCELEFVNLEAFVDLLSLESR